MNSETVKCLSEPTNYIRASATTGKDVEYHRHFSIQIWQNITDFPLKDDVERTHLSWGKCSQLWIGNNILGDI